jgi:hypothetical protein
MRPLTYSYREGERFPCPICGMQFVRVYMREPPEHYAELSGGIHPVYCDTCRGAFFVEKSGDQYMVYRPWPPRFAPISAS